MVRRVLSDLNIELLDTRLRGGSQLHFFECVENIFCQKTSALISCFSLSTRAIISRRKHTKSIIHQQWEICEKRNPSLDFDFDMWWKKDWRHFNLPTVDEALICGVLRCAKVAYGKSRRKKTVDMSTKTDVIFACVRNGRNKHRLSKFQYENKF